MKECSLAIIFSILSFPAILQYVVSRQLSGLMAESCWMLEFGFEGIGEKCKDT